VQALLDAEQDLPDQVIRPIRVRDPPPDERLKLRDHLAPHLLGELVGLGRRADGPRVRVRVHVAAAPAPARTPRLY
jgi:hypothetical protein